METTKVIVFKERNEEYAISVEHVISIERPMEVTPIPHLPEYMAGMVKIRGDLVPVIDIHSVFYGNRTPESEKNRLILIKTDAFPVALFVEEAKELLEANPEQIRQVGLLAYKKTAYFTHVIHRDDRLITVLDPIGFFRSLDGMREIYDYMEQELHPLS